MEEPAKFGRQFYFSSKRHEGGALSEWKTDQFGRDLFISSSPLLSTTRSGGAETEFYLLGDWYDPERPGDDNSEIAQRISRTAESWSDVENLTAGLSGRWCLVGRIGKDIRIYLDACGLKPLYYMGTGPFVAASQPALLAHLGYTELDQDLMDKYNRTVKHDCWPVHVYPFAGVERLLSNHYLSLPEIKVIRHWPIREFPQLRPADAVDRLVSLLQGTISAFAERHDLCFSLTGGYDTRTIVACTPKHIREASKYITVLSPAIPVHDRNYARLIARKLKLDYSTYQLQADPAFCNSLQYNVGYMYPDPSTSAVASLANAIGGRTHCTDVQMALLRNSKRAIHPKATVDSLLSASHFRDNPLARAGFERWYTAVPRDCPIDLHDLLNLEHRKGDWAASGMSFREAAIHQVSPANSVKFTETTLSVPHEFRTRRALLQRRIIRSRFPVLDRIPYNMTRREQVRRWITGKLPEPVKRTIRWALP